MTPMYRALVVLVATTPALLCAQTYSNTNSSPPASGTTRSNTSPAATTGSTASPAPDSTATAPAVTATPPAPAPPTSVTPSTAPTPTPAAPVTTLPAPAASPPVPPRAADVTPTTSTPGANVRSTASDPAAQVQPGGGLTTTAPTTVPSTVATPAVPTTAPGVAAPGALPSDAATTAPNVAMNETSATGTSAYLRAAEIPQRDAALRRVEAQLMETGLATARLPQTTAHLPPSAQVEYSVALQEVQAREAQLRTSLQLAQQAPGDGWAEARNRLAADYDAYVQAMLRARAAGNATTPAVPAE